MSEVNRKKTYTWILWLAFLAVVACLGILWYSEVADPDMYFLIATGREILKNGIPYVNPWTIDQNQGFIAQQWLYCVLLALSCDIPVLGYRFLSLIQVVIFIVLMMHFFKQRNVPFSMCVVFSACALGFGHLYMFNIRPELITIILLLSECIFIERFISSRKWPWLLALPVLMAIEINVHSSMWIFHFAVILAYAVPALYMPGIIGYKKLENVKIFAGIGALMFAVMFLNPYGLDGILYIYKSFLAKTFNYLTVSEMEPPEILGMATAFVAICIVFLCICQKIKTLKSVTCNLTVGFCFVACLATRNNMFLVIPFIFLLCDMAPKIEELLSKFDWMTDIRYCGVIAFLLVDACVLLLGFIGGKPYGLYTEFENIYDVIIQDYDENTRIFTGFNSGGFFECEGLNNLYIDSRPEIYTDRFTGDKNLLSDYSYYCIYGYDVLGNKAPVTVNEMDEWFESYGFDYIVLNPANEIYLYAYISRNPDYEVVFNSDTYGYKLYKKL